MNEEGSEEGSNTAGGLPAIFTGGIPQFADDLPPGCPPTDAILGPMRLFRLVPDRTLTADHFRTTQELGTFVDRDPCQRCAVSMQGSLLGAKLLKKAIPHFANDFIACGTIPKEGGKLKATPSQKNPYHWSWWPAVSVSRHSYFAVVDDEAA